MTPIESLPAKWWELAENLAKRSPTDYEAGCIAQARADADELANALAAQPKDGELLASLLNRPNRVWRSESETGTEELARGIVIDPIELRTLASRRVVDEMVERGLRALEKRWGWKPQNDGTREEVRAILEAALQPDSGEVG